MVRRDPDKPGLKALDTHKEAFEQGRITASEIAEALGITRQVVNRAIGRKGWKRPATASEDAKAGGASIQAFTTEEASALLVSLAVGVLVNCHDLVNGGGLSPSSLKAIATAAAAAEATLERRGIIATTDSEANIRPLEIRVLNPAEEEAIRVEIEAAAGDGHSEIAA